MGIVGGQQRSPDAPRDIDQVGQQPALRLQAVVLDLDEEAVLAEDVLVGGGGSQRRLHVAHLPSVALLPRGVGSEPLRHRSTQTARGGDDAGGVLRQQLGIHTRLVVVAVEVGAAGQLHQIAIPQLVLGQQRHVIADVLASRRPVEA